MAKLKLFLTALAVAALAVVGVQAQVSSSRVAVVSTCGAACLPNFPVGSRCYISPSAVALNKRATSSYTPQICFGHPLGCVNGTTLSSTFVVHALSDNGYPACPVPSSAFK